MRSNKDAFIAGWEAHRTWMNHEWGPEPPSDPDSAFAEWMNTCSEGHLTFKIDPPMDCAGCRTLIKRGPYGTGEQAFTKRAPYQTR